MCFRTSRTACFSESEPSIRCVTPTLIETSSYSVLISSTSLVHVISSSPTSIQTSVDRPVDVIFVISTNTNIAISIDRCDRRIFNEAMAYCKPSAASFSCTSKYIFETMVKGISTMIQACPLHNLKTLLRKLYKYRSGRLTDH